MIGKRNKSIVSVFQKHIHSNEISDGTMFFIDLANYLRNRDTRERNSIQELITLLKKDNYYTNIFIQCIISNFKNLEFRKSLSDTGILDNTNFFEELKKRFFAKIIPEQPQKNSFQYTLNQVLFSSKDFEWINNIPNEEWIELMEHLKLPLIYDSKRIIHEVLLAMHILSQRMGGLALQPDILKLVPEYTNLESPFLAYDKELNELVSQIELKKVTYLPFNTEDKKQLQIIANQCFDYIERAYQNSSKYGISFKVNQNLLTIKQELIRVQELTEYIFIENERDKKEKNILFYKKLVQYNSKKNNIRELINDGLYNITYEITSHTAKTGEHYITNNKSEYFKMLYSASLGGIIVGFLCIFKLYLSKIAMSDFGYALAYSLNYAGGFVFIYLIGATLATKQPAMTATTIARTLEENLNNRNKKSKIELYQNFALLFSKLFRSQFIAFVGNVLVAFPVALLLIWSVFYFFDYDMAASKAPKLLKDLNPVASPAIFHAAIAGVFLFLSGIVAGNVANNNKFNNFYYRIAEHPKLKLFFGEQKTFRISKWLENKWPGVVSNLFFGFCLGSTASIGTFLGLNLDIRHITFASGNFALGLFGSNYQVDYNTIFWSIFGIFLIGLINFLVSFGMSLFIAIKSREIPYYEVRFMSIAIWGKFKKDPLSFFVPKK